MKIISLKSFKLMFSNLPCLPLQIMILVGVECFVISVTKVDATHGDRGDVIQAKGARPRARNRTHGYIDPPRLALAYHEDPPTADVWLGLDLNGNILPLLVKLHHLNPQLQTLSQLTPSNNTIKRTFINSHFQISMYNEIKQ